MRNRLTVLSALSAAVLVFGVTASARAGARCDIAAVQGASQKIDISGKWLFTVVTDAGTGSPTVTLKQQGDSLTGRYSSQLLGESDLKGVVKDKEFSFSLEASVQGTSVTVTYTGTIESKDSLKGTVDLAGMAGGTFTAKRQSP